MRPDYVSSDDVCGPPAYSAARPVARQSIGLSQPRNVSGRARTC